MTTPEENARAFLKDMTKPDEREARIEKLALAKIEALNNIALSIQHVANALYDLKPEPKHEPERTIYSPRMPQRADIDPGAREEAWKKLQEEHAKK